MDLAVASPGSVHLLDYGAFYWPPWTPWGVAQLYRTPRCILPAAYAVHLWETKMWRSLLGNLRPETLAPRDTCFARLAAAVHNGSFAFGDALLGPDEPADTASTLVSSSSLLQQLGPSHRYPK